MRIGKHLSGLVPALALGVAVAAAGAALAAPVKLLPADPQPASLRGGLAVAYAYPIDVKTLADADAALRGGAEGGMPLRGLSYASTGDGERPLTAKQEHVVAAAIRGFIRFDAPGIYDLEFFSNDGLRISIGGKKLATHDDRTPCDSAGAVQVEVPVPGWYPLDAVYFQRLGTACLQMEWAAAGKPRQQVPDAVFGH